MECNDTRPNHKTLCQRVVSYALVGLAVLTWPVILYATKGAVILCALFLVWLALQRLACKGAFVPPLFWPSMAWGAVVALCLSIMEHTPMGGPVHWLLSPEGVVRFMDKSGNRGLCAMAVLVWPLLAALWSCGGRTNKILAVCMLGFCCVLLGLRPSASAMVGFGLGAVAFALAIPAMRPLLKVALVAAVAWAPMVAGHALYVLRNVALPDSFMHRLYIWDFAWQKAAEKPLLGWGFDSARHIEGGRDVVPNTAFTLMPLHPHNAPLQILLELGLVGFACLLAVYIFMLLRVQVRAGYAAWAAYLGPALFAFGVWQGWWMAVAVLGAVFVRLSHGGNVPRFPHAQGAETVGR